jgi:hypothetical protein
MSALAAAINLQFGKSALCYQDVICEGFALARILIADKFTQSAQNEAKTGTHFCGNTRLKSFPAGAAATARFPGCR